MKKKSLLTLLALLSLVTVGCVKQIDESDHGDISIGIEPTATNNGEFIKILTDNDYWYKDHEIKENNDGSYTITVEVNRGK